MKTADPLVSTPYPPILLATETRLSRTQFSAGACQVVQHLQQNGFEAYIVGGAVRDILLNQTPKDFDVATDASPESVRRLFRRAYIIGRRFRIVHVVIDRRVIEVSTFRKQGTKLCNSSGRIMRDNIFGHREEDMWRRDFTINALLYEPTNENIIDHVGGLADLTKKQIVTIGDPAIRYREDPIRILRAIRFSAKLDFNIEKNAQQAIFDTQYLLDKEPPARLFDEMLKYLTNGYAVHAMRLLQHYQLTAVFPFFKQWNIYLDVPFIMTVLQNTDKRVRCHQTVSTSFLLATLVWPSILILKKMLLKRYKKSESAMLHAIETVDQRFQAAHTIPRCFMTVMKALWAMQECFESTTPEKAGRLLKQPYFRAGLDFFLLRAKSEQIAKKAVAQWIVLQ